MVCRAKPKYYSKEFLKNERFKKASDRWYYFNRGRSGLQFLLKFLKEKGNIQFIGLQSFNCEAVFVPILECDLVPVLFDIKDSDFSISLKELKNYQKELDILILTHYQGIPNLEYLEILDYCREKDILVIEDLAQTYCSAIKGVSVGTLGDFSLFSFAVDKPMSSYYGGAICINNELYNFDFFTSYSSLTTENNRIAKFHIDCLNFYDIYYSEESFTENLDNKRRLWEMLIQVLPPKKVYYILKNIFLSKLVFQISKPFFKSDSKLNIEKLHPLKISLIENQKEIFEQQEYGISNQIIKEFDLPVLQKYKSSLIKINWNRISFLDATGNYKKLFNSLRVKSGNFNWPQPLHILFPEKGSIYIKASTLAESERVSKHILNIPCWYPIKSHNEKHTQ